MKLGLYIATLLAHGSLLSGCARPPTQAPLGAETKTGTTNAGVPGTVSNSPEVSNSVEAGSTQDTRPESPLPAHTLCAAFERALFSCAIEDGQKTVSICASRNIAEAKGYVYYVYGTPNKKELIYPADKSPPADRFKRTHLSYAGNTGGYAYSFTNNRIQYIVYSMSGANALEEHGVMVLHDDSRTPLATHHCREDTVMESGDEDLMDLTLGWKEDAAITHQGLPAAIDK